MTHAYFLNEDKLELQIMKVYVPLGILYISAYLEKNDFENEVFDTTFSSFELQIKKIIEDKPDILAIYTNLMTKLNVLRLIKEVKQNPSLSNTRIILGGPEVRHHAKNFLEHGADVIVIGEGEETMLELVKALQNKQTDLSGIDGIAYNNNEIIFTKERTLIDINTLPFPNRSKVNFSQYLNAWKNHHGHSMMTVNTMRGCPYTCKWCSKAVYKESYRRRSPELVAEELSMIKDTYNPDMIWFVDDVFTIHHRWLKEFTNEVKKRDVLIPYEIISRPDRLDEQAIKLLRESGCFRIWIGAESGSQKIIDAMDRRINVIQTRKIIKQVKQYGIQAGTFIMLGYPGETKDDIKQTIEHLVDSNPDLYTITIAYPIKGTILYSEVESKFIKQNEWKNTTDRDIDFTRLYSRSFYEHAIKWVQNEVSLQTKNKNIFIKIFQKIKSFKYQTQMLIESLKNI